MKNGQIVSGNVYRNARKEYRRVDSLVDGQVKFTVTKEGSGNGQRAPLGKTGEMPLKSFAHWAFAAVTDATV